MLEVRVKLVLIVITGTHEHVPVHVHVKSHHQGHSCAYLHRWMGYAKYLRAYRPLDPLIIYGTHLWLQTLGIALYTPILCNVVHKKVSQN